MLSRSVSVANYLSCVRACVLIFPPPYFSIIVIVVPSYYASYIWLPVA